MAERGLVPATTGTEAKSLAAPPTQPGSRLDVPEPVVDHGTQRNLLRSLLLGGALVGVGIYWNATSPFRVALWMIAWLLGQATLVVLERRVPGEPASCWWCFLRALITAVPCAGVAYHGGPGASGFALAVLGVIALQMSAAGGRLVLASLVVIAGTCLGAILGGAAWSAVTLMLFVLVAVAAVTQPVVAGFRNSYQRSEIAHQRLVFATRLLVERQTALEEHAREAREAAEAKAGFLATMSHEIRTPLNGIIGILSLLRETPPGPEQVRLMGVAEHSSQALLEVIGDILDFSKMEAGHLSIGTTPFDPAAELEQVGSEYRLGLCRRQGISLELRCAPDVPHVVGDPGRVGQIIRNFLSNAVKFTDPGGLIAVELTHRRTEPGRVTLRYSVRDTGVGMNEAALQRVFQRFEQAHSPTAHHYGGTGLGLAICRELATRMGGEVGAVSELGVGSTFWLELPLTISEQLVAVADESSRPSAPAGLRVLLVEDNSTNRLVAERLLRGFECIVEQAVDGEEALQQVTRREFDLVLMDCHMPGMNGFETTLAIREFEKAQAHPPVTIVALTAMAIDGDRELCIQAGMNDYLTKPLSRKALADVLKQVQPRASLRVSSKPTSGAPPAPAATNPEIPPVPGTSGTQVTSPVDEEEVSQSGNVTQSSKQHAS